MSGLSRFGHFQHMRSITYHELRPGTIFSHADFHFLSPISLDKSIDSPLELYDGPESKPLSGKM